MDQRLSLSSKVRTTCIQSWNQCPDLRHEPLKELGLQIEDCTPFKSASWEGGKRPDQELTKVEFSAPPLHAKWKP